MKLKKHLTIILILTLALIAQVGYSEEKAVSQNKPQPNYIYKILTEKQWENMNNHEFDFKYGSVLDIKDGYLHLSQAHQVQQVAQKYYQALENGKLVKINYKLIAQKIKWEPNSKGELFPHSYDPIPKEAVVSSVHFNTQTFDYASLED